MKRKITQKSTSHSKDLLFAILASDVVLWTIGENKLLVRLIPVNIPPHFINMAGVPGGLIKPSETAEEAASRLVESKGKIQSKKVYLEQLYTFSALKRDPRGRVVAVGYTGIVPWDALSISERKNTDEVWWIEVGKLPTMAYDHKDIISTSLERLQSRIAYTNLISQFMPKEFTLTELEKAYEVILGKDIDKRNFRKKILALGLLRELPKERRGQKHRPAKLYSFKSLKTKVIEVL